MPISLGATNLLVFLAGLRSEEQDIAPLGGLGAWRQNVGISIPPFAWVLGNQRNPTTVRIAATMPKVGACEGQPWIRNLYAKGSHMS